MTKKGKTTKHVHHLAGFFNRLRSKDSTSNPQTNQPEYLPLQESSTQTTSPPLLPPQELPAEEITNQTLKNDILDIPFAELKAKYFDKAPMNNWVISLELQKAISYKAPFNYQKRLLSLLVEQTQKIDALCIGITQLREPIPTTEGGTHTASDKNLLFTLAETVSNNVSHFLNTSTLDNPYTDTPQTKNNVTPIVNNFLDRNNSSIYPINLRPTQAELQNYPQALIKIIEDFLSLIQEKNYQNFLTQVMNKDYESFTRLNHPAAFNRFYQDLQNTEPSETNPAQHSITREDLNAQFYHKQEKRRFSFAKEIRKKLNTEFRWMMSLVLHSLLLNLRKELSMNPLWQKNNASKLLQPFNKQWIIENQNDLKDYLKRLDSAYQKIIPIEYPIKVTYQAKVIHPNSSPQVIQQTKIDEALRWIDRVERCMIAPLGNIKTEQNRSEEAYLASIFSSNNNFVSWLRNDPSISFFYSQKKENASHSTHDSPRIIITIKITDIQLVNAQYFNHLRKLVDFKTNESALEPPYGIIKNKP